MKYHILTPFKRIENLEYNLKDFHKPNVIWHPIYNDPEIKFPKEDWIEPYFFTHNRNKHQIFFEALNKFIVNVPLVPDDYYHILADDDSIEPDFYEKLKGIDTEIILVSMKRGDNITKDTTYGIHTGYSTRTLNPRYRYLARGWIGAEQYLIKGKALIGERFYDDRTADGNFIRRMKDKYPFESFTFKTDTFVWFNYYEPGRWNK
jgi:hypothetical protein